MKPAELQPLVGRKVEVYVDGERVGTVKGAPKSDTITVQLLEPHGRHRVRLEQVRGVWWRGRLESVREFLTRRAGGVA